MDLNRIKLIAKDIISDDEWVNDSHTSAEHKGIKDGLDMLIRHLEQTDNQRERWFHKADKKLIKGYWYAKITDIKF